MAWGACWLRSALELLLHPLGRSGGQAEALRSGGVRQGSLTSGSEQRSVEARPRAGGPVEGADVGALGMHLSGAVFGLVPGASKLLSALWHFPQSGLPE